jgi:hypothetical protein
MTHLVAGGYATQPDTPDAERAFYDALLSDERVGLEIPLFASGLVHKVDENVLLEHLRRASGVPRRHVMTLVPGTMVTLGGNKHFGLASDDAAGRQAALALARKACDAVQRVNAASGPRSVVAVEVHSAPSRVGGDVSSSATSLAASLAEMAAWDWAGAELVVEHCDAGCGPHKPAKGFLTQAEEIEAVTTARAARGAPIGVAVNWARSVLETRDTGRPLEHIKAAGPLLRGIIFSGCSGAETAYGSFADSHMPWAEVEAESLLTRDGVRECCEAAGGADLLFSGAKITLQPPSADAAARAAANAGMLSAIRECLPPAV